MLGLISTGMMVEVGKFRLRLKVCTDDLRAAVTPDEAAESLVEWINTFDISHTGEYWAPRGPRWALKVLKDHKQ